MSDSNTCGEGAASMMRAALLLTTRCGTFSHPKKRRRFFSSVSRSMRMTCRTDAAPETPKIPEAMIAMGT